MHKTVAFTNHGKNAVHIGPKTVRPNETREVDERDIPPALRGNAGAAVTAQAPAETAGERAERLANLLDNNIPAIKAALPDLSISDVNEVAIIEGSRDKPRAGVLEAIAELKLKRASDEMAERGEKQLIELVADMTDETLLDAWENSGANPDQNEVLESELKKRKLLD